MTARGVQARQRDAFWNHPAWKHAASITGTVALFLAMVALAVLTGVTR